MPLLQPLIPSFGPLGPLPAILAQIPPSLGSHFADRVSDMSEAVGFSLYRTRQRWVYTPPWSLQQEGQWSRAAVHIASSIFLSVNKEPLPLIDPSLTVGFAQKPG